MPKDISTDKLDLDRERLLSLINSMADGVIAVDQEGKIAVYNGAALNILDINKTLQDEDVYSVVNLVDKNNQSVNLKQFLAKADTQFTSRDYRLKYADKTTINLFLSIAPVRLGYGKEGAKGHVILMRDITREKSLEEERDEFISVVSHELRTPVAIAEGNIGNAEFIIEKSGGNEQIKQALKVAHQQVIFLSGMINDLSTLSRAERGALKFEVESINPHDLVQDLAKSYKTEAADKGLSIKINTAPDLEILKSSSLYAREILQNFVTNAIKYTEKGSITIGAKRKDNGTLFEVSDTGIGISKTDKDKVFDKFFRSEDYRTRASNGTGLGLYVTMKLARLLHADISLESELNKGSTFSIYIPNLN